MTSASPPSSRLPRTAPSADAELSYAMVFEFADVDSVIHAAEKMRDGDFTLWDVHTPFPVHGLPRAMGLRPTILPWIALTHGLIGIILGLGLVWWTNAVSIPLPGLPTELQGYEYLASGKPRFSLPANIPIIFELAVLLAAIGTLLGLLGLNKLPQHHNPLFKSRLFRRATSDRFLIVIESMDPKFDPVETPRLLQSLGALAWERIEGRFTPANTAAPAPSSSTPGSPTVSTVGVYQTEKFPFPWPARLRRELRLPRPPKPLILGLILLLVPVAVLLGMIAYARTHNSPRPRVHLIQDMDVQPRFGPQESSSLFNDKRSSRLPMEGTIARGHLPSRSAYDLGYEIATDPATNQSRIVYLSALPAELAPRGIAPEQLLERGRVRFSINCAVCHGPHADGDSAVNRIARKNNQVKWVPAPSLLTPGARQLPDGQIALTIRNGVRSMAPYGAQIDATTRWAIVAYLRQLQAQSPLQPTATSPSAPATQPSPSQSVNP